MKNYVWVVEVRDQSDEAWTPCVGVALSRRDARRIVRDYWRHQFGYTRVRKYEAKP